MTRAITTCILTLAVSSPAFAQGKVLAEALGRMHAVVTRNVVEAAEKMPEADFAFQPTKDVRTFAGFVGHVANSEFGYCARVKGEANPNKEDYEKIVGKVALVAGIKAAVAYCDAVYTLQTDGSLSEMITMGQSQQPRGQVLVQNISHSNEHYGNLVTYMRIKGLVPPSTERATAAARPGGR
jgi:uncharacterized damage-inducible protein DinB